MKEMHTELWWGQVWKRLLERQRRQWEGKVGLGEAGCEDGTDKVLRTSCVPILAPNSDEQGKKKE
jgi:hypothetical protein